MLPPSLFFFLFLSSTCSLRIKDTAFAYFLAVSLHSQPSSQSSHLLSRCRPTSPLAGLSPLTRHLLFCFSPTSFLLHLALSLPPSSLLLPRSVAGRLSLFCLRLHLRPLTSAWLLPGGLVQDNLALRGYSRRLSTLLGVVFLRHTRAHR